MNTALTEAMGGRKKAPAKTTVRVNQGSSRKLTSTPVKTGVNKENDPLSYQSDDDIFMFPDEMTTNTQKHFTVSKSQPKKRSIIDEVDDGGQEEDCETDSEDPVCQALAKQQKLTTTRQVKKNIFSGVLKNPTTDDIGRDYKVK